MMLSDNRTWYYLGCRSIPGHQLFNKHGTSVYLKELLRLDGQLCPVDTTPYHALLTRLPDLGYSALAWWDYTVDRRGSSNSIIFAPSPTCPLSGIRSGMERWFSWVETRLPQALIVLDGERIYHGST